MKKPLKSGLPAARSGGPGKTTPPSVPFLPSKTPSGLGCFEKVVQSLHKLCNLPRAQHDTLPAAMFLPTAPKARALKCTFGHFLSKKFQKALLAAWWFLFKNHAASSSFGFLVVFAQSELISPGFLVVFPPPVLEFSRAKREKIKKGCEGPQLIKPQTPSQIFARSANLPKGSWFFSTKC